jgi:hypothetical protein
VVVVRTDVSEERVASIIRLTRIGELGTLAITGDRSTLNISSQRASVASYSEKSVLTRVTRRNIPDDGTSHSHRREFLKSYAALTGWALQRKRNVSPVRNELGSYIPEDGILHIRRLEILKSYIALTG